MIIAHFLKSNHFNLVNNLINNLVINLKNNLVSSQIINILNNIVNLIWWKINSIIKKYKKT